MDLSFTEEQGLLRETIRSLLQKYSSPEIVRELEDAEPGYRLDLWEEVARQGLLGLTIPEAGGGSGMTPLEQVILYEEFGRALTASPHFVSCVLGDRLRRPAPLRGGDDRRAHGARGVGGRRRAARAGDGRRVGGGTRPVRAGHRELPGDRAPAGRGGDGDRGGAGVLVRGGVCARE